MKMYCGATGLPFTDEMLTWKPMEFPEWTECMNYMIWHGNVIRSSGFLKQTLCASQPTMNDLPSEYKKDVERAQPFYEKLYHVRTAPTGV